ncbi:MAG: ADP-glyceromanno-heptose 6-epimerase [Bacteroidales bacterium]|jgi:ADP-L-glycero-D-manno-heptose 6-epimerase|nr:ADP-glyceromanno-heptose 6-epimerase [Bacteroidales bacterium]
MKYIAVTGSAGFIGSCMLAKLHEVGLGNIVAVDDFSKTEKSNNIAQKLSFITKVDRDDFFAWVDKHHSQIQTIIHLGARTDTTETHWEILNKLNLNYTQEVWKKCSLYQIPLIYASSGATYGGGEYGYNDSHELVEKLQPLNLYGVSKNEFDKWALQQPQQPPCWAGLKFFNVYGSNEYHKKRMASVIFHAFNQMNETGKVKLFRSHRPDCKDGGQSRDFVYVKDVVDVICFLMEKKPQSGLYNLGTGKARSFLDLAKATFKAMNMPEQIEFVDTPEDIRDKYQYFTQANMQKLIAAGYTKPFTSLEDGVNEYVKEYLINNKYY